MGFKASHVSTENKEDLQKIPNENAQDLELTKTELEILLRVMADTTLKGRDIEAYYNLIVKLQDLYVKK